ncbi:MAG TPA: heavy metal-associated domain-containing protein [Chitinophaga sp.]|uniref:heavy-metal-associated domain-containing protein n=1 Tax=Chitinophaga sp. TaxID=1869181 RepID=UPI002D0B0BDD|nr:heavy metal-associated domain-containing protein [Chitinophaga sp.]HVI47369.1 heavy metal-associated domain-containing protein [Chitinophaga sp.]
MRILKLLTLLLLAVTGVAMAQQKKKTLLTAKISTPTVQCESCKKRIERYMSQEEGVEKVTVDFKKHVTTVKYWEDRTNIENIKTGIANTGYDADNVSANPESYAKLPTCCKKPEDGGGMDKKKQ